MLQTVKNIYQLGVKELISLCRDWLMLVLIVYCFTFAVVTASRAQPDSISNATIAVVDEDRSQLTGTLSDAFIPPMFIPAKFITRPEIDPLMDEGKYTFAVVFPPDFEKDVLSGKGPEIQVNVDATRMTQAYTGAGYIQQILNREIRKYTAKKDQGSAANCVIRNRFNPNLTQSWFSSIVQLVNNITMLAIILTGAALIRERENGTLEHLLVMPVTAFEIMMSKIWSMMAVVLVASAGSLYFVIDVSCGPHRGLRSAVSGGRGGPPLRRHVAGDLSGLRRPQYASAGNAAHSGLHAHADAFGRHHAPRKYARVDPEHDARRPHDPFRELLPVDPLPRRGDRGRLEALPDALHHRRRALLDLADLLPQVPVTDRSRRVFQRKKSSL